MTVQFGAINNSIQGASVGMVNGGGTVVLNQSNNLDATSNVFINQGQTVQIGNANAFGASDRDLQRRHDPERRNAAPPWLCWRPHGHECHQLCGRRDFQQRLQRHGGRPYLQRRGRSLEQRGGRLDAHHHGEHKRPTPRRRAASSPFPASSAMARAPTMAWSRSAWAPCA